MLIAEFARRAGVAVSTVRFYERTGMITPPTRTSAGYRDYDEDALRRVRYLRRGQELGFTLTELTEFTRYSDGLRAETVTAGEVAHVAQEKLRELDARIADLQRIRTATSDLLESQCIDPDEPCPIVDALAGVELDN